MLGQKETSKDALAEEMWACSITGVEQTLVLMYSGYAELQC